MTLVEASKAVSSNEIAGILCFVLAIFHTFAVKQFRHLSRKFPEGSASENFYQLLGEVEVVFGLWGGLFLLFMAASSGSQEVLSYLNGRNFTEPAFVFVIMVVCSTRPILQIANALVDRVSRWIPLPGAWPFYLSALIIGPLLGSFITEPAAMTVTALILLDRLFKKEISLQFKYATLGLLFVNISIGGTLTPYAAPPVLMVASQWGWDLSFMLIHFGWKAALSVFLATSLTAYRFRRELNSLRLDVPSAKSLPFPKWVYITHLIALVAVVLSSHHLLIFLGIFMFFLGLVTVTREYQTELKLKEGLLVAFFLAGLVILGGPQRGWLEPILTQLNVLPLYLGAISLTAITDNAALTYLGSLVPTLSDASKYALVAGAVVGGGLTVIANAPNPAGHGILNPTFGEEGISPLLLFSSALGPTLVAAACFLL